MKENFLQNNLKEMLNNLWSCRCSLNLSSDKEVHVINNSRNFNSSGIFVSHSELCDVISRIFSE